MSTCNFACKNTTKKWNWEKYAIFATSHNQEINVINLIFMENEILFVLLNDFADWESVTIAFEGKQMAE
ncbi:hypothetical protein [uncultured Parabacteroides sp.]|uniref:hypothetical protein n=1 Tax=uncultured Parabacteroides sp. TaxID=512312 RepID=UPI0028060AF9|nr:hypothetical protein [uncultured Parabacteroides sp.]